MTINNKKYINSDYEHYAQNNIKKTKQDICEGI